MATLYVGKNGIATTPKKIYVGVNGLSKAVQAIYTGVNGEAVKIYPQESGGGGIYGAEWDGSSVTTWTRTDDAANFPNPNPYYAGMSGTPSSPFDNISPWADMKIVEDSAAGTLVEIPKFYYKWTRTGSAMKLQISTTPFNGSFVSPAHADRGDGKGERDVVYVGRYHCASDYKSKTGVTPYNNQTQSVFRSGIHNLGSTIWQYDFAMYWTICMLYLVEFADWNSQDKIGYGCSDNSSVGNMGYTDNMPYHTGTTQSNRTTYGLGTQYRYIEGLWDNVTDWCDGIYFAGTSNADVYCIKNPASFSDTTGGTKVGTRATTGGYEKAFTAPSASGFEYALYPNSVDSNLDGTTYTSDQSSNSTSGVVLRVGGAYNHHNGYGLFCLNGNNTATTKYAAIGSRLMKLP